MLDMITPCELERILYFVFGVIVSGVVSGASFILSEKTRFRKFSCMSNKQVKM